MGTKLCEGRNTYQKRISTEQKFLKYNNTYMNSPESCISIRVRLIRNRFSIAIMITINFFITV